MVICSISFHLKNIGSTIAICSNHGIARHCITTTHILQAHNLLSIVASVEALASSDELVRGLIFFMR